jgi:dolichyl-phosphate-mannose--protein O-mannosyl transferase
MRFWTLLAGIAAIAGLDLYALSNVNAAPLAVVATCALFAIGFRALGYFGGADARVVARASRVPAASWHDPASAFRAPLDYLAMTACAAFSFALSFVNYWTPPGKIFDEVYFARAAEEYLRNERIYESTHPPLSKLIVTTSVLLFGGLAHGDTAAGWRFLDVLFGALAVAVLYALARRVTGSTLFATLAALFFTFDGMHFVQSRVATPEGIVVFFSLCALYAIVRSWVIPSGIAIGALIACKWYGVMMLPVALLATLWRKPASWWNVLVFGAILATSAGVYSLAWTPDLVRQSPDPGEVHTVADVVARQYDMYEYHSTLRATHPYSSKWWEWPLDYVPVAYYYEDSRADKGDPKGCCIAEVTSMPNPIGTWLGLLSVPLIGVLAWRERNRAYALIVATYLLQWLPWSQSPRVSWEYHFYVDVPLIALCNAIALQRLILWSRERDDATRRLAPWAAGAVACAIAGAFVFFYPVLAAVPIPWETWYQRMWLPTWIIGPG